MWNQPSLLVRNDIKQQALSARYAYVSEVSVLLSSLGRQNQKTQAFKHTSGVCIYHTHTRVVVSVQMYLFINAHTTWRLY